MRPSSSIWPASIRVGSPSGLIVAMRFPSASLAYWSAAGRTCRSKTACASVSKPDGERASSSSARKGGTGRGAADFGFGIRGSRELLFDQFAKVMDEEEVGFLGGRAAFPGHHQIAGGPPARPPSAAAEE